MTLVLAGTVAPMSKSDEAASFSGRVWFDDRGSVAAVTKKGQASPAGFDGARLIDVSPDVIYPGLVDLHSHLGYNTLPLWFDRDREKHYDHHDSWPGKDEYPEKVSWSSWTLLENAAECVYTYFQVRALAGGTTSIQGWPNGSRDPANKLVRSVDDDPVGKLRDPVMVSALTQDQTDLAGRAANLSAGRMFVYHCSEGRPGTIVTREFDDLGATGCLQKGLAAVHCSALDESHFAKWKQASGPGRSPAGAVVWSPFSNLWLYGITTQVDKARRNRLAVCLGTDWGPSGTKNLLGELKVARIWSDHQGWGLTDHDLVRMVTASPGDALAQSWGQPVGRLVKGGLGDALILTKRDPDPWANLVAARESDVLLVVVEGRATYGRDELMQAAGERSTTSVPIGRFARRVSLVQPNNSDKPWTWKDVINGMESVRAKAAVTPPVGSSGFRRKAIGGYAVVGDPPGTPPFVARPDMPGAPSQLAGPPPAGRKVKIPAIQSVYHDRAWLESIKEQGFHGGVLDSLVDFY